MAWRPEKLRRPWAMGAGSHVRALKSLISGLAASNMQIFWLKLYFSLFPIQKFVGPALCIVRSRKSLRLGSLDGVFTVLCRLSYIFVTKMSPARHVLTWLDFEVT